MSANQAATLALGVAGAAVGGFVGAPHLGFALGSSLGAQLFQPDLPDVIGPRLNDLSVTSPALGRAIPLVYGTRRLATSMLWTAGRKETRHSQEVGGKGGPSQTQISFTYSMSAAYGICEGPITGVRRIWINSELVYDQGDTASILNLVASNEIANAVTIYTGSETQEPSALMEADKGAGNVSAHRGLAYLEFDTLQLARWGNTIQNVEVEVVKTATPADPPVKVADWTGDRGEDGNMAYDNGVIRVANAGGAGATTIQILETRDFEGNILAKEQWSYTYAGGGGSNYRTIENYPEVLMQAWDQPADNGIVFFRKGIQKVYTFIKGPYDYGISTSNDAGAMGYVGTKHGMVKWNDFIFTQGGGLFATDTGSVYNPWSVTRWPLERDPTSTFFGLPLFQPDKSVDMSATYEAVGCATANTVMVDETYERVYFYNPSSTTHRLVSFDTDLNYISHWDSTNAPGNFTNGPGVIRGGEALIHELTNQTIELRTFDPLTANGGWTVVNTVPIGGLAPSQPERYLAKLSSGMGVSQDAVISMDPVLSQTSENLSAILTALATRAGLTAGDLDVTGVTDTVRGYAVGSKTSARNAMQPLISAYTIDAPEIDNKITFIPRGGATVASIPDIDLGAHANGQKSPDLLSIVRTNDNELPKRLTITYTDVAADYDVVSQHSDRLTVQSESLSSINVPIVFTADEAVQISDKLLYAAWAEREVVTAFVGTKYIKLTPGDSVLLGTDEHRVRITEVDTNFIGVIKLTGVMEYADVYTSIRTGSDVISPVTGIVVKGPSNYHLLDIPILRDNDDGSGYYLAMDGYLSSWDGGILYKSVDGGETYAELTSDTSTTSIGNATDVLADAQTLTWDNISTVNIRLVSGTISAASDINVLNGANGALLGQDGRWEVIQWANQVTESDGTITLSRLLRGRRGTEHNTANHLVGDVFIALTTATVQRIVSPQSEINAARSYKGVTLGNLIQDVDPVSFTDTGIGLKPFSPVNLAGTRDGSNNLTVTWNRRSRLGISSAWVPPLGEDTESYELEFFHTSGTPQYDGIKTATSETFSYTAAAQTTDSATPGQQFLVNIYQISTIIGRGYVGSAII